VQLSGDKKSLGKGTKPSPKGKAKRSVCTGGCCVWGGATKKRDQRGTPVPHTGFIRFTEEEGKEEKT